MRAEEGEHFLSMLLATIQLDIEHQVRAELQPVKEL